MTDAVAAFLAMEREVLLGRWEVVFGRKPPPHSHASFLRLALAWQVQAQDGRKATVGLPKQAPRKAADRSPLRPGTRLVREWQGTTYHVQVTGTGFEYAGKPYRSLSAIARTITGTAWSGPAFFGIVR